MKHGTVEVELTTHEENLTDLMHLFAIMGFVAGFTDTELIEQAKNVIQEQYLQSILNAAPPEELTS